MEFRSGSTVKQVQTNRIVRLILIAVVAALSAGPVRAGMTPEEAQKIAEDWIYSSLVKLAAKIPAKSGVNTVGGLLELETTIAASAPEGFAYTKIAGKPKIALDVRANGGRAVVDLHMSGELALKEGAGIDGALAGEVGGAARLTVTFTANQTTPGELTRLFTFLLFGLNPSNEQLSEQLLKLIPDKSFADLVQNVGSFVGNVAAQGASAVGQARTALAGVQQVPGARQLDGALAGVQGGLAAVSRNQPVFQALLLAFKTAPPLSKLLSRVKFEGGLVTNITVLENQVDTEATLGREWRRSNAQNPETNLTTLRFQISGKGPSEGQLCCEVKLKDAGGAELVVAGQLGTMSELVHKKLSGGANEVGQVTITFPSAAVVAAARRARVTKMTKAAMLIAIAAAIQSDFQARLPEQDIASALKDTVPLVSVQFEGALGLQAGNKSESSLPRAPGRAPGLLTLEFKGGVSALFGSSPNTADMIFNL